jgi:hypothetical protein
VNRLHSDFWSMGSDRDVAMENSFGGEVGFGELVPLVTGHGRDSEDIMMHIAVEKC